MSTTPRFGPHWSTAAWIAAWLLALGVVVAPPLLGRWAGGEIDDWIPIYIAGAIGGAVLELLLSRWQIELPTRKTTPPPPPAPSPSDTGGSSAQSDPFDAPLGPRVDVAVFGRMFTGGLAAVAALIVADAVVGDEVVEAAASGSARVVDVGWAIVIGAASPAIWDRLRKAADSRLAAVLARDEERAQNVQDATAVATENLVSRLSNSGASRSTMDVTQMRQMLKAAAQADPATVGDLDSFVDSTLASTMRGSPEGDHDVAIAKALGALEVVRRTAAR